MKRKRSGFRVLIAFGTRPEAIKLAPVVAALKAASPRIETRVVVTAQHREMLDQVLSLHGIVPDHDLDVMRPRQTLTQITHRALERVGRLLDDDPPDLVLVQGDTTTSFTVALAAFYRRVAVGHVEAGLRTYDKFQPFPEEMNRVLTSHLADWHYAPTRRAREALLREGIPASRVLVTGNTVIDAVLAVAAKPLSRSPVPGWRPAPDRRLILVTAHRRENLGEPLREICGAILDLVDRYEDVEVIYPLHLNPAVREVVRPLLGRKERVRLVPPLDYHPFVSLMAHSTLILTDSGGIQEEAPSLGKPVLVLRHVTERPEAVEAGTVKVVGP
ncbi:MAG: UDP-N-acetylglucosamine 2-epimerase (non-hydrolyzing), partial [Deltaproteobacteria bacterium]|nr:UDP-N-acetylglucosamine 2-epimerase (non-hydrolyzing) [Deltaproteobacteria bacterium]